jgi:hypothetical protein
VPVKKYFIYALLVGSLGSLGRGQQPTDKPFNLASNGAAAVNHKSPVTQAVFGPVLVPPVRKQRSASLEPDASAPLQSKIQADPAPVPAESLGEIARRYRSQKNQQYSRGGKQLELP